MEGLELEIKRAKMAQYMRDRRLKNLENCLLYEQSYREKSKDKIKEWNDNNVEKIRLSKREYQRRYVKKNPNANKIWRENNKEHRRKYCQKYSAERRKISNIFKLKEAVANLINVCFKRKGYVKSKRTEDILGCTIFKLREHLLSKCPEGVTIEDFGQFGYHIDHIVPISLAKTEDDVLRLNHYTNLQPLWWKDNILKSNKLEQKS